MKKRLEAELISLAHRVLKLKNKSEINQLYLESRKLYETLAVLKFYGDNYEQVKSEITQEDLEEKLTAVAEDITLVEVKLKEVVPVKEELVAEATPEVQAVVETIEAEAPADVVAEATPETPEATPEVTE